MHFACILVSILFLLYMLSCFERCDHLKWRYIKAYCMYVCMYRASTLQICLEQNSKRTCMGNKPSEWYRRQNWWGGMCISWNSWWRCSIARTLKICLDWHQKSDFELNSNLHLRHSCNQNMQNIVTWGQNMSANIKEFACISMGGLFSGVPPYRSYHICSSCRVGSETLQLAVVSSHSNTAFYDTYVTSFKVKSGCVFKHISDQGGFLGIQHLFFTHFTTFTCAFLTVIFF